MNNATHRRLRMITEKIEEKEQGIILVMKNNYYSYVVLALMIICAIMTGICKKEIEKEHHVKRINRTTI